MDYTAQLKTFFFKQSWTYFFEVVPEIPRSENHKKKGKKKSRLIN